MSRNSASAAATGALPLHLRRVGGLRQLHPRRPHSRVECDRTGHGIARIAPLIASGLLLSMAPCVAAPAIPDTPRPRVILAAGSLDGSFPEGAPAAVFKGIPFAQSPVGPLRWHEPVAVKQWKGVKDASSFGPACLQNGRGGSSGNEDCLYLNVWTPEWPPRSSYSVMLWLFGGANVTGSASNPAFDGSALARRGVVVVTANYRLGVMGFMAHPALSAESGHTSSGNYALLDQIMALRWIRENIARFGGDPRHVTLFGQSSGSYDLLLLMMLPLANGLFVNAIAQSGQLLSYNGSMSKARAEEIGTQIAAELKTPEGAGALSYLRALPADQVMAVAAKRLATDLGTDTGLLTNVDGWVLPELPARVFADGRQLAIPLDLGKQLARDHAANLSRRGARADYGEVRRPRAEGARGLRTRARWPGQ